MTDPWAAWREAEARISGDPDLKCIHAWGPEAARQFNADVTILARAVAALLPVVEMAGRCVGVSNLRDLVAADARSAPGLLSQLQNALAAARAVAEGGTG